MAEKYTWTDNPTESGKAVCDTDVLNDCLMHLKYDNKSGSGLEVCDIGIALYVDETKGLRRYLNGQIVDINTNTQAFLDRLKQIITLYPALLTTEENWQAAKTLSPFGQVGKFVFNYADDGETVVSVRIPRVVNIQGLFDLKNLGLTVEAGLPTHTHTRGTMNITGSSGDVVGDHGGATGAFYTSSGGTAGFNGGSVAWKILKFDASRNWTGSTSAPNNSIYGKSNTVQEEAIQYPYFIQIATGQETEANIVNTLENVNGFTLLESKYSDKPLYNESWLLSNGQWNAKAVYPTVYEGLQVEYNTEIEAGTTVTLPSGISYTKRGLSVKLWTDESATDYDFRINTADETFRLPLLDGSEDLLSDRYDDLELLSSGAEYIAPANGWAVLEGTTSGKGSVFLENKTTSIITADAFYGGVFYPCLYIPVSKNNVFTVRTPNCTVTANYFRFIYAKGNGSLYYYVGETVQNANLIDAGRIGEQLAGKLDLDAQNLSATGKSLISGLSMPSDKYIDLTLGASGSTYTAPANGYFHFYSSSVSNSILVNRTKGYGSTVIGTNGYANHNLLFVNKNDVVNLSYSTSLNSSISFFYANGSESEA